MELEKKKNPFIKWKKTEYLSNRQIIALKRDLLKPLEFASTLSKLSFFDLLDYDGNLNDRMINSLNPYFFCLCAWASTKNVGLGEVRFENYLSTIYNKKYDTSNDDTEQKKDSPDIKKIEELVSEKYGNNNRFFKRIYYFIKKATNDDVFIDFPSLSNDLYKWGNYTAQRWSIAITSNQGGKKDD